MHPRILHRVETKILITWDNDWINLVRPSFLPSKWIFERWCHSLRRYFFPFYHSRDQERCVSRVLSKFLVEEGRDITFPFLYSLASTEGLVFSTRKCIDSPVLTSRTKWSNFLQDSIKIWQSESDRDRIPLFLLRAKKYGFVISLGREKWLQI